MPNPHKQIYFCTQCGACCKWPGLVRMNDEEIDRVAASKGMGTKVFIETCMDLTPDRRGLTLMEKDNGHCLFFEEPNLCQIYRLRPKQCRDFPNKWDVPNLEERCSSIRLRYERKPVD